jgi:hypothetical protein
VTVDHDALRALAATRPGYATYPEQLRRTLRAHPDTIKALPKAEPPRPWQPAPVAPLAGIRVVPDETLPVGAWRLVDEDVPPPPVTRWRWWRRWTRR